MIYISKEVYSELIDHAKQDLPLEACGYLAGKGQSITHSFRLKNTDQSPEHFSFDPAEQFKVMKQVRALGLEIIGNYHSHPSSPARPSKEDIRLAYDNSISYVIISLAGPDADIKSFRIQDDTYTNDELVVIEN